MAFPLAFSRGGRARQDYMGGFAGGYPWAPASGGGYSPWWLAGRRMGGGASAGAPTLGNQFAGRPPERPDPLEGLPMWKGGPRNKWSDLGLRSLLGLTQGLFIPQLGFAKEVLPAQQGAIRSLLMALSSQGEEAGLRRLERGVTENVGELSRMLGSAGGLAPEVLQGLSTALAQRGAETVLSERARLASPEYQRERELARIQAAGLPIEGLGSILQLMQALYPLMSVQQKKGGLAGAIGALLGGAAGKGLEGWLARQVFSL